MAPKGVRRSTHHRGHQGAHRPSRGSRGGSCGPPGSRRQGPEQGGPELHHQGTAVRGGNRSAVRGSRCRGVWCMVRYPFCRLLLGMELRGASPASICASSLGGDVTPRVPVVRAGLLRAARTPTWEFEAVKLLDDPPLLAKRAPGWTNFFAAIACHGAVRAVVRRAIGFATPVKFTVLQGTIFAGAVIYDPALLPLLLQARPLSRRHSGRFLLAPSHRPRSCYFSAAVIPFALRSVAAPCPDVAVDGGVSITPQQPLLRLVRYCRDTCGLVASLWTGHSVCGRPMAIV